jgi:hypothetical protein
MTISFRDIRFLFCISFIRTPYIYASYMNSSCKHEVYRFRCCRRICLYFLVSRGKLATNQSSSIKGKVPISIQQLAQTSYYLLTTLLTYSLLLLVQFIKQVQSLHKHNQERNQIRSQVTNTFPQFLCP